MDLQTRKLNVIEYLIGIDDEKIFSKIEATIFSTAEKNTSIKPFTQEELLVRAKLANEDYSAGRVTTQEELETESEKW